MKRIVLFLIICLPIVLYSQSINTQKKILMVVSSYGKDLGETRPGYEFDEFSQAYLIFKSNNVIVDVASPKGGKVEADKFNKDKPYNKTVQENKDVLNVLNNTKATATVNAAEYDAIYIVGGKGAMFDLPYDASLQDIILDLYRRKGTVISSVCHGSGAFVNIKDNEAFIIKDVALTGFCNKEEELFGKKWVKEFPFSLEDKLKSRGVIFKQADFMLSNVTISGKFITGQNPYSTTKSAEELIKALGIQPVSRKLYTEEKSISMIQEILENTKSIEWAEAELGKNKEKYDIPLIAAYGYYRILAAKDNRNEVAKGIALLELTSPHYFNENLELLLAKTYVQIGEKEKAKMSLNKLISKNLLKEKAEKLLKEID